MIFKSRRFFLWIAVGFIFFLWLLHYLFPVSDANKIQKIPRVLYYGVEKTPAWTTFIDGNGTFSSPRAADLNSDGIKDIVLGAGRQEFQASDTAMMAIDGQTGALLWYRSASDQIFGSALLYDINGDGIEDVFIGGRTAILEAIDGATGELIWEFAQDHVKAQIRKKYFNFYNPQLIPDQDGDGLDDIIVSNGGDVLKQPFDRDRPAGLLMVLSSATGRIIQEVEMPDGKETYQSVVLSSGSKVDEIEVVFGTGGETIGGNLYVCSLTEVLEGDLSKSTLLASSENKGFVAPAVWVDINGDGREDIVSSSVGGKVYAFDGITKKVIWETAIPGTEIYSTPAIGLFNRDTIPDVFVSAAIGVWPNFSYVKYVCLNGETGEKDYVDTLGYFQSASPVVVDLNGDGLDEVLVSVNYEKFNKKGRKLHSNTLYVIDFLEKRNYELLNPLDGHNIAATPWIGDLDDDGHLDIIFCHSNNIYEGYAFDGMKVHRLKTKIAITTPVKWGSYMGSGYKGKYNY